ncbi:MAG TPA: hypothetical protein P5123_00935 [Spirochaetota bacterium]|nr:hypothetical protein [Spirochaetota bacterium]
MVKKSSIKKSKVENLESRGYVDDNFDYTRPYDILELEMMLKSVNAVKRTQAALVIGYNRLSEMVPNLIISLQKETKLYSKIAICNALYVIGDASIDPLLDNLGLIGNNQYNELPDKAFGKGGYPLPRDIVARTLVRMGEKALIKTVNSSDNKPRGWLLEAVDVMGHISFYNQSTIASGKLLELYYENINDLLLRWKLIRAFSAFELDEILAILQKEVEESRVPAIKWEAERSLRMIGDE